MKRWIGLSFFIFVPCLLAELSPADMQNIQMLRAQNEARQREEDFKNPVQVSEDKERATLGNAKASIRIITYSDFQCPYCKNGAETAHEVLKKYGNKVSLQFRHFPLNFHPYAMAAAKRFEALALQGTKLAFKFHDEVFQNQETLKKEGEAYLDAAAKKVGANIEKMKKDLDSEKVTKRIQTDMAEASKLGVSGTPAFIVAGVRLLGAYPASEFSSVIDRRLKAGK